jgi:hypothetical protein
MEYKAAYINFSKAFTALGERLNNWVAFKKGSFDTEGYVKGLSDGDLISYEQRNDELDAMLQYVEAVEHDRQTARAEVERLKTRIKMLETAEKAEKYTDTYVLAEFNFLIKWTIQQSTDLEEYEAKLKDTIFFIELASKRKLIELDEVTMTKLTYAKRFMSNKNEREESFFIKKNKLKADNAVNAALIEPISLLANFITEKKV